VELIFSLSDHIIRTSNAISSSHMSLSKALDEGFCDFGGGIGEVG